MEENHESLQPIGKVLEQVMGTAGTISMPPEPPPLKCEFCGGELRYRRQVIVAGYVVWLYPNPCTCPGAVDYANKQLEEAIAGAREEEKRQRAAKRERLLKKSGLPARYHTATLKTLQVTEPNSQAIEAVRRYIENPAGGLMFLGPVGTGKSHLAACVVNAFLDDLKRVTFGGVVDLLGRIRRSYSRSTPEGEAQQEEEWEIIDELTTVPLLVLDDLGKERVKDWVEEILFRIIDNRYGKKRPIIVTTNFSPEELQERYPEKGYAIMSRLAEMCTGIYLGGNDWRRTRMRDL